MTKINCYGYAMMRNDKPVNWLPTVIQYLNTIEDNLNDNYSSEIRNEISSKTKTDFESWLTNQGYIFEPESGFSGNGESRSLNSNQYRIVLRTGLHAVVFTHNGQIYAEYKLYNYHFWYQLYDGRWQISTAILKFHLRNF